jgi:acyl-CoA synthetase (AMP-forming)/AMP-acid ligase II
MSRSSRIRTNRAETLLHALERHCAERPHATFCHFWSGDIREDISFQKLRLQAAAYAGLYRESGLKAGDVALIMLQHSPDMYYAFIGAMLCGCIPSMMPFPSPKQDSLKFWESHRELFKRIGAGAIITYPENADGLRKNMPGQPLKILMSEERGQPAKNFGPAKADLDDIALIQHSSGTTGLKKGVQLSYRAIAAQIASYSATLAFEPSDCIASWLPLYHDMGLIACFILPLTLGLPVVSIDPFEWVNRPALLFEAIQAHRCTHAWLPNFAFHHLCRAVDPERGYVLDSMKAFINCSEPCKPETFDLFLATFANCGVQAKQLQACYAMAETVFAVTQTTLGQKTREYEVDAGALMNEHRAVPAVPGKPSRRILSTGAVIPGLEIRIDGHAGEIEVRGAFLFGGYYKNEIDTRQAIADGWYKTGDTGFIHDGELYVLGRLKEMIIVCGKNLYANDLEYICNQAEGVKKGRCVVFGLFDPDIGTENLIVVAETEIEGAQWAAIRRSIKSEMLAAINIPPHDIRIVSPGWLVKSTSGKISRGENLQKYLVEKATEKRGANIV